MRLVRISAIYFKWWHHDLNIFPQFLPVVLESIDRQNVFLTENHWCPSGTEQTQVGPCWPHEPCFLSCLRSKSAPSYRLCNQQVNYTLLITTLTQHQWCKFTEKWRNDNVNPSLTHTKTTTKRSITNFWFLVMSPGACIDVSKGNLMIPGYHINCINSYSCIHRNWVVRYFMNIGGVRITINCPEYFLKLSTIAIWPLKFPWLMT